MLAAALCAPIVIAGCDKPSSGSDCDPNAANTICTIAGTGGSGYSGDDGPATKALLYTPQETAVGPDGELWLLDYNNYLVRSIDKNGIIHTRVGSASSATAPRRPRGRASAPRCKRSSTTRRTCSSTAAISISVARELDRFVELSTMLVVDFAGPRQAHASTGDGGPALKAAVDLPASVTVAPNGDVVFMDQANQVIRSVDATGNIKRLAARARSRITTSARSRARKATCSRPAARSAARWRPRTRPPTASRTRSTSRSPRSAAGRVRAKVLRRRWPRARHAHGAVLRPGRRPGRVASRMTRPITDPRAELALAEVHDCFTPTELVLMEDLGFAERGQGWKDVLSGTLRSRRRRCR